MFDAATDQDRAILQEMLDGVGAIVMGRKSFDKNEGDAGWGDGGILGATRATATNARALLPILEQRSLPEGNEHPRQRPPSAPTFPRDEPKQSSKGYSHDSLSTLPVHPDNWWVTERGGV